MAPLPRLFNTFNTNEIRSENYRVTEFVPLEL